MGDEVALYLRLGVHHIADLSGYDHILFVTALSIPYALRDWRRLAVLVTAFTLGHSLTLALATLRVVAVPGAVVEALIPATILVTALLTFVSRAEVHDTDGALTHVPPSRYLLAAVFGLIHGLGFSTYLRSLLGEEESIVMPLLAFNVGLEVGQLMILSVVLALGWAVTRVLLTRRRWEWLLASVTAGLAVVLLLQRL